MNHIRKNWKWYVTYGALLLTYLPYTIILLIMTFN